MKTRMIYRFPTIALGLLVLAASGAQAQSYNFSLIDFPSAAVTTRATGINSEGQIVGRYTDSSGRFHGFLLSQGVYTSIDVPGALFTIPHGINNEGQIVGRYGDASGTHGFLLSGGSFTTINFPGALATRPQQINSRGDIVGTQIDAAGRWHAFLLSGGTFTSFDFPGATMTEALGINAEGVISCVYLLVNYNEGDRNNHAFVLSNGEFTSLDPPGSTSTFGWKMNERGQIVGCWTDASGTLHGLCAARRAVSRRLISLHRAPATRVRSTMAGTSWGPMRIVAARRMGTSRRLLNREAGSPMRAEVVARTWCAVYETGLHVAPPLQSLR